MSLNKRNPSVIFLKFFLQPLIWNIKINLKKIQLKSQIQHDLGNILIQNVKWKFFFMSLLCCFEVGWVSKFWGMLFLVVSHKDGFTRQYKFYQSLFIGMYLNDLIYHLKNILIVNQQFRVLVMCIKITFVTS
jgi:hypothetical protein